MSDFLLEIGCEEIPARMLADGVRELGRILLRRLGEENLAPSGPLRELAGPRRMAVQLIGLPARQPDRSERLVGPPVDKAFDTDGRPTRAAIGFAQKLGVEPAALERVETPKGVCIAGVLHHPGRAAAEVLAGLVPEVVLGQSFPKTMRWGRGEFRYVRAIRNVVALLDGDVVALEIAGVPAGRSSFGHRFLGARRVEIEAAGHYEAALAAEHVTVDAGQRAAAIRAELHRLAATAGGTVEDDPVLLEEVTYFIEEPHVVLGRFDQAYLELPHEVLVTSMKHHQKGFPIWSVPGQTLAPAFLAVANVPDREGHIARGFERVLNARLADARFFWQEDRKQPLQVRLDRLERVTFHEKLGSYGQKTRRIEDLAPAVAHLLGFEPAVERSARAAAHLCKADLSTGMVGEFAELQGVVGGLYLEAEGADAAVARAVYEHYRPASMDGPLPATEAGMAVAIADKIDTLTGCFGAGLVPTGTRDPFGLRRAAQGVVRVLLARGREADAGTLLALAAELHAIHPGAPDAAAKLPALAAWLAERVEFVLRAEGHRPDTLEAVLAVSPLDVVGAASRARALSAARKAPGFEQTFTVFKRVANIAGLHGPTEFDAELLREPMERALAEALGPARTVALEALARRDHAGVLAQMSGLAGVLNEFFEKVLVMDPDKALRENRLRLLRAIGALAAPIGDFSKLQVEQGKANQ